MSEQDRVAELEARFSFLDDHVQTLDGIVAAQRSKIDQLETQITLLRETLETIRQEEGADAPEPPPPHY